MLGPLDKLSLNTCCGSSPLVFDANGDNEQDVNEQAIDVGFFKLYLANGRFDLSVVTQQPLRKVPLDESMPRALVQDRSASGRVHRDELTLLDERTWRPKVPLEKFDGCGTRM
jgi:hypothetical protein